MPDRLIYSYGVRRQVAGFPEKVRRSAELAILRLLDDPVPPEAKPFTEGLSCSNYELATEHAVIFYLVIDDTIMINNVQPNT